MLAAIRYPLALSLVAFGLCTADPASAAVVFASTTGSDAAAGTAAAPVKTLAKALTVAADSDTIILRDPGDYGPGNITKNITILSPHGGGTFGANASCLNINAPSTATVIIDGYLCDADGKPQHGIVVNSAHRLILNNIVVRGGAGNVCGLLVQPSNITIGMHVKDSIFGPYGANTTATAGAICMQPQQNGFVGGSLNRVSLFTSANGLRAAAGNTGGGIQVSLVDAVIARNSVGILSSQTLSTVAVSNSLIAGNGTGLSRPSSGKIVSLEGNSLSNAVNGTFSATVLKQ